MKPCVHDSRSKYELLIEPLRAKARELGYALAVHGTLKRDIDLLACPWTRQAVDARTLALAMRETAAEHNGGVAYQCENEAGSEWFDNGCQPYGKPHGRRCWTFHLGGGPYIDLSVMPRLPEIDFEKWLALWDVVDYYGL